MKRNDSFRDVTAVAKHFPSYLEKRVAEESFVHEAVQYAMWLPLAAGAKHIGWNSVAYLFLTWFILARTGFGRAIYGFGSSPESAQPVCQSRDFHKGCFGVLSMPHLGERRCSGNPSDEGGCIRWVALDRLV